MAASEAERLTYGHRKYAALHLMFSRLIRVSSLPASGYIYVTLGGTELRDVQSLRFIDPRLGTKIFSFEHKKDRYDLADKTVVAFRSRGIDVQLINGSFFDYERKDDLPHIFFLDLEGICATWGGYDEKLGQMFQDEIIRERDLLLITSALGRDKGIKEIFSAFFGEFSVLSITDEKEARKLYRRSHPSFTLYRGLNQKGLTTELQIRCLGCIKYQDPKRFPMGLYGFAVSEGVTDFKLLVNDANTQYYDMNNLECCAIADF
jgi:hypothetical protein